MIQNKLGIRQWNDTVNVPMEIIANITFYAEKSFAKFGNGEIWDIFIQTKTERFYHQHTQTKRNLNRYIASSTTVLTG